MQEIKVLGLASGRTTKLTLKESDRDTDLLSWLRANGITVASSCDGEGVCKKCDIQNGWLTCQLTLQEFLQRCPEGVIVISYL